MREVQSPSIATLIGALVKAQAKIGHAVKDSTNPHFKSGYASLEAVIDVTKGSLAEQGLVILQQPDIESDGRPILITTLAHTSGEWMRSFTPVLSAKADAQGLGSGLSYSRRYALAAMTNISQTDDDGNEASGKGSAPSAQSKSPQQGTVQGPAKKTEPLKTNTQPPPAPIRNPGAFVIRKAKKEWEGETIDKVVATIGQPAFQKDAPWWWETSRNKDFAEIKNFKRHFEAYLDEQKLKREAELTKALDAEHEPSAWAYEPWPGDLP